MADEILVKQDGPILRITLNAPDRGNAVTDDNVRELTRLINGAGEKADMVVLRGVGKDFCVGRAGMGSRPATEPTAYAACVLPCCIARQTRSAVTGISIWLTP